MLMIGYLEGIDSQRGIAWRCEGSLSLRRFLGVPLGEETPDHSSLTRIRDRLSLEVHDQVFHAILGIIHEHGLLKCKTAAVDSTLLEALQRFVVNFEEKHPSRVYDSTLKIQPNFPNPTTAKHAFFNRLLGGNFVT